MKILLALGAACVLASSAQAAVVYQEDFNGSVLPSSLSVRTGCPTEKGTDLTCYSPDNVAVRDGRLVLSLTPGTLGRPYDGASVSTFCHGFGWPPPCVLEDWTPPMTVEARMRFSAIAGAWQALWMKGTDREAPVELDAAEVRGAFPTQLTCHVHNKLDEDPTHRHLNYEVELPFDFSHRMHTYFMRYPRPDKAIFGVFVGAKRLVCAKVVGITRSLSQGLILDIKTASAPWGGAGGPPAAPAEMLVDWIRVSQP